MGDKIKVLMVGPDRSVHGGISAMVNSYYEAGLGNEVDLKYIGTMREGSKVKKLFVAIGAYLEFASLVSSFDVVHVNAASDRSFMRKSYFIRCAKRHGKKVVLHQHGGDFKNYYENQISSKRRSYFREILDMADVMLVLTSSWKEYFGNLTKAEKIIVFPNGVKTAGYEADNIDVTFEKKDLNKLLFLGRICTDKGIDELIKAVSELHDTNPRIKLYLGGIYEDERYKRIIEECPFAEYLGWISGKEKDRYLQECGVYVLPSYYEGLPVSILEAMLHGCVVVSTKVGGIPEIISDGKEGYLVEPKNANELRKAIKKAVEDKAFGKELATNARKRVLEQFSIEKSVVSLVRIYKDLVTQ